MKPTIAIIQFPGTNREREAFRTSASVGFVPFYFRWNDDFAKLKSADAYLLPGGFSYEDRSRSGIMCALDPVMEVVREEAKTGKPVLGICNGAQMLIESGMVPGGVDNTNPIMCIARNVREKDGVILGTGFINVWVNLKTTIANKRSAFTYDIEEGTRIKCPIAHGEGRYTTIDKDLIAKLDANNQIALKYCDENGEVINEYPTNPNGAMENIAALINPEGNIMAAMPHFEHFPEIGEPIFRSMYKYVLDGSKIDNLKKPVLVSVVSKIEDKVKKIDIDKEAVEMFIRLIITDNEAQSVSNTLQNIGHDVSVDRVIHYEIEINKDEKLLDNLEWLIRVGELLNTSKELCDVRIGDKYYHFSLEKGFIQIDKNDYSNSYLVREIDDYIGQAKLQVIKSRFLFENISSVKRGIIWTVNSQKSKVKDIIDTKIFHNPNAQNIYKYN
jgi:phosphoribosylformylglycinamidine synthase